MRPLPGVWLGRVHYDDGLDLQERLRRAVLDGAAAEVVLYLEHPDVITLGRSAERSDVLADDQRLQQLGVDVRRVARGGDVTYHGPGQLVVYAIVRLSSVLAHVAALGAGAVAVAANLGVEASLRRDPLGVFVGERKLAALGVHVQRRVATHGLALNVTTDLSRFGLIVPCGRADLSPTSLVAEAAQASALELPALAAMFHGAFCGASRRPAGQVQPFALSEARALASAGQDASETSLLSVWPPL